MSRDVFVGGCLCGAIRYRAEGKPFDQTNCHCTLCRRAAGAPFLSWATFPTSGFAFTEGEPATYRSSVKATRQFCARCGTQLTFQSDDYPEEIDLTVASMDDPEHPALQPKDHLWLESHLSWVPLGDLPRYPTRRSH